MKGTTLGLSAMLLSGLIPEPQHICEVQRTASVFGKMPPD
jgi:hypothetical protein